jgi:hypothetical protein
MYVPVSFCTYIQDKSVTMLSGCAQRYIQIQTCRIPDAKQKKSENKKSEKGEILVLPRLLSPLSACPTWLLARTAGPEQVSSDASASRCSVPPGSRRDSRFPLSLRATAHLAHPHPADLTKVRTSARGAALNFSHSGRPWAPTLPSFHSLTFFLRVCIPVSIFRSLLLPCFHGGLDSSSGAAAHVGSAPRNTSSGKGKEM